MNKIKLMGLEISKIKEVNNQISPEYKPIGYWDNQENIQNFIHEIANKLNLKTPEDWNLLTRKQILQFGGSKLLQKYSMYEIKCLGCPNGENLFRLSISKPNGYWSDKNNVLNFLNEIKEKLNLEDFNSLTSKQILFNGGASLLKKYSLFELKSLNLSKENENQISKSNISSKPYGFWDNNENIMNFLENLQIQLRLDTPKDWNLLTRKQILQFGGSRLLQKYSMYEIRCLGCPKGKELFRHTPKTQGYWDNKENIEKFIDELKEKLNLKTVEDWKRLSHFQIKQYGGDGLINKFSLEEIIQFGNPDIDTVSNENYLSKRSSQRWLFLQVQKLFPHDEIVEDYFHSDISRETGYSVQFDIFLIKHKIAFEYHGKQHYEDIPKSFAPLELYQRRDEEKIKLCKKFGIHLIIIPYWWDNTINSLKNQVEKALNEK